VCVCECMSVCVCMYVCACVYICASTYWCNYSGRVNRSVIHCLLPLADALTNESWVSCLSCICPQTLETDWLNYWFIDWLMILILLTEPCGSVTDYFLLWVLSTFKILLLVWDIMKCRMHPLWSMVLFYPYEQFIVDSFTLLSVIMFLFILKNN